MFVMAELIITINSGESISQNRLVLELFLGTIKVTKSGLFSGPLRKISVYDIFDVSNISELDCEEISRIIRNVMNSKLTKNRYSLLIGINEIINIAQKTSSFILTEDKKYHCIEEYKINRGERFELSFSNNILSIIIPFQSTEIFSKNEFQLRTIIPKCKVFLDFQDNVCTASVKFEYDGVTVNASDKIEIVETDNSRIMRNKVFEEDSIRYIRDVGFICLGNDMYKYTNIDNMPESLEILFDKGIEAYSTNGLSVNSISSQNISISYDMDWFSVNVKAETETGFIDISDKIDLSSRYIELNGQLYLIPSILRTKKIKKNEKGLVLSKNDYIDALLLASKGIEKKIINIEKYFNDNTEIDIPSDVASLLRPYQCEGVKWLEKMYRSRLGACLADDMGLGKTIQAISFLELHTRCGNSLSKLVIVPKSLLINWKNEISKFAPNLSVIIYHGSLRKISEDELKSNTIILSTFGTVLNDIDFFKSIFFDVVIIDEIQYIKNYNSRTYKAISRLKRNITVGLSGTPFENNITELWSIMNILNKDIFKNKSTFVKLSNSEEFNKINKMIVPFILRREKKNVLNELPDRTEIVINCEMEEQQCRLYNSLRLKILSEINRAPSRYEIKTSADILKGLLLLRQTACHPMLLNLETNPERCVESAKYELLKDKVSSLIEAKEKVIIFSQFTSMLKIIEKWLIQEKIKYYYLDGKTDHRQMVVDEFEKSDEGVFLISLKAGGVGLNLTSCHYVIIYDPWWNPAAERQAADRVYRIGQRNDVFVYKLIVCNTIEEKIQQLQEKKNNISDSIFKDIDIVETLNMDDLLRLFND